MRNESSGRQHIDSIMIGFIMILVEKVAITLVNAGNLETTATKNMALESNNATHSVSTMSFPVAIPSTRYVATIYTI